MIPEKEQAYKLPDNWQWTTLGKIANWGSGGTPSRRHKEYFNGDIPWVKTGELKFNYIYDSEEKISLEALNNSSAKIYPKDTVIIAMYAGNNVGNVAILGIEAAVNQACACAVCNSSTYFKYLFYYIIQQKNNLIAKARGSVQENISQEIIKNHLIPLPPVDEQIRIVERIESLFEKLNRSRAMVQKIVDGYELRRGKILYDAFTGKLTNSDIETWQNLQLKDTISNIRYGTSEKSDYEQNGIPVLRIPNIADNNNIDFNDLKYLSEKNINDNFKLNENDILIIRSNGSRDLIGKCALVPKLKAEFAYASFLMRIIPAKNILPKFFVFYLNSIEARLQIFNMAKSTNGIHNINSKELGSVKIKLPNIEEQKEIVRHLDSLLTKELQIKEFAEQTLQKIDLMKKTILARAFRGELLKN